MRYLKQALGTVASDHQVVLPSFTVDGGKVYYMGVEIVAVGIADDTMLAGSRDNMVFLTDLLSETKEIKAQRGNDLTDENMWYAKAQYRAGADFIFDEDIVVYNK